MPATLVQATQSPVIGNLVPIIGLIVGAGAIYYGVLEDKEVVQNLITGTNALIVLFFLAVTSMVDFASIFSGIHPTLTTGLEVMMEVAVAVAGGLGLAIFVEMLDKGAETTLRRVTK